jgi:hypothetical protein
MSGKLITAKIDVTKIVKSLLYVGKKGTYLDLIIWQNEAPDQYGNDFSIQQRTGKDDPKIYIGEGKYYVKKEADPGPQAKDEYQGGKKQTGAMSDINELPGANDNPDNLPF